jgi:hypothetical protein
MASVRNSSVRRRRSSATEETDSRNVMAASCKAPASTTRRQAIACRSTGARSCARKWIETRVQPRAQSVRRAERVWRLRQAKTITKTQTVSQLGIFSTTPIILFRGGIGSSLKSNQRGGDGQRQNVLYPWHESRTPVRNDARGARSRRMTSRRKGLARGGGCSGFSSIPLPLLAIVGGQAFAMAIEVSNQVSSQNRVPGLAGWTSSARRLRALWPPCASCP